jgi:hypothetical protein
MEGTWATPDTPEKRATLAQLMSKEFPVGPDATNATEQLYDLIGDDVLFDRLETLATTDADADARQIVYDRMQELADHPDIRAAMAEFTADVDTPEEPTQESVKDPASQTEDPADTEQPTYDEYDDSLANILKRAGVDDTDAEPLSEFAPIAAAIGGALARGAVGAGASALQRGATSVAGQAAGNEIGNMLSGDDEVDEGKCNMSEAGESCPVHGVDECAMEQDHSPLSGQYGHSGKMKAVGNDISFLDRLKELSGMMRK